MDGSVRADVAVWLLVASAAVGAVTGLALGIVAIVELPLGPSGDLPAALGFSALLGLLFAGSYALVCGGLLRLLIRARDRQASQTAIFLLAGVLGGGLFVPLATILTGGVWRPLPFEPVLLAASAVLFSALAYRSLIPPIQTREH
jgi:hypothetical protein